MKVRTIAAAALMSFSAAATALDTLDEYFWPETGRFPAYPAERDERTVRFSVFGGYERDNNPFRLSDTVPPPTGFTQKSDTLLRYGAGLRVDVPQSRQRFILDLQVENRDYNTFNVLDHTEYRGLGQWRWQAGNQWSGDVGYSKRRFLGAPESIQAAIKDMVTEDRFFANAGYLITPSYRVRGGAEYLKWDHDEPTRVGLDARIWSYVAGLDYLTAAGNSIGGQVRYSEGDYPNRQAIAPGTLVVNDYQETETSLVVHWILTGKSTLDLRAGYTKREHDQVAQRDFDGFTGRASADWFVGAKTLLNFALWREVRSTEDVSASYIVSEGWSIGPAWAPTVKTILQLRYLDEEQDYRGDPSLALGAPQREDHFRGIFGSAGYQPIRNFYVAVTAQYGGRDSNIVGRGYNYTAYGINARYRF